MNRTFLLMLTGLCVCGMAVAQNDDGQEIS